MDPQRHRLHHHARCRREAPFPSPAHRFLLAFGYERERGRHHLFRHHACVDGLELVHDGGGLWRVSRCGGFQVRPP